MKSLIATVFVTVYYILNYTKSIPIIYKAITTKETDDYSLTSIAIAYIANVSWVIYITPVRCSLYRYVCRLVITDHG